MNNCCSVLRAKAGDCSFGQLTFSASVSIHLHVVKAGSLATIAEAVPTGMDDVEFARTTLETSDGARLLVLVDAGEVGAGDDRVPLDNVVGVTESTGIELLTVAASVTTAVDVVESTVLRVNPAEGAEDEVEVRLLELPYVGDVGSDDAAVLLPDDGVAVSVLANVESLTVSEVIGAVELESTVLELEVGTFFAHAASKTSDVPEIELNSWHSDDVIVIATH